jgi:hypothetical protein
VNFKPFLAVVVAVAEEVLGQEHPQPRPERAGKHQQDQQQRGGEDEHGLHHRAPFAAEQAQVVAGAGHQQQVDAGAEQAGAVEGHAAGQPDRRGPLRVACRRHGDQRRDQGDHVAARDPGFGVEHVEQRAVGIKIEVVDEQAAEA